MKKKKNKNPKWKIAQIKYQTLQLRKDKQIPYYLAKLINDLDGSEMEAYVKWLTNMAEHYMRIKGYYKKYPEADQVAEEQLKRSRLELGF